MGPRYASAERHLGAFDADQQSRVLASFDG